MSKAHPDCAFVMSSTIHLVSGRLGTTAGFNANTNAVTEDNDGELAAGYFDGYVDLTHILSYKLGKQLSQMATYRVSYIQMDLRNVNNVLDNDTSLTIGGVTRWYCPTKHRVDALQFARQYKRNMRLGDQAGSSDPFTPWQNDTHYQGIRFNWSGDDDIGTGQTTDDTAVLAGTNFSLKEVFEHYNDALGGTPGNEGRPTSGEGQALWNTRTAGTEDDAEAYYWVTTFQNRMPTADFVDDGETHMSFSNIHTLDLGQRHIEVLGGLLYVEGVHTNTDTAGIAEDEYYIQMTIGVEGWSEF